MRMNGWSKFTWSTTMHYFDGLRSLCGGYGFLTEVILVPDSNMGKCATCEKKLADKSITKL